mmetsp:Transcript_45534/g.104430  ORF Transcript_45534/g.104430 Transcript_45534/m.104430 type:complete len:119 (+) Transcript_45534:295-651(+)
MHRREDSLIYMLQVFKAKCDRTRFENGVLLLQAQNGWRYFGPSNISTRRLAIVVHANWMIGESTKRACLQAAGLWFVSDQDAHEQGSGIQCRSTLSFPQAFFSKTMASGEVRDCRPLV